MFYGRCSLHFKSHSSHFSSIPKQTPVPNPKYTSFQSSSLAFIIQQIKELKPLQKLHAHLITSGLSHNIFLSNRLMNSYASLGFMPLAEQIFQQMPHKNVVTWTVMVSGFGRNGLYMEALEVFSEMTAAGVSPNAFTVVSVLPACVNSGFIPIGKSVHCFLIRLGMEVNVYVETSLVDMYVRCGSVVTARKLFDNMVVRNVVSWNVMISGYAEHGVGEKAFQLYKWMQNVGYAADFVTIMSLLPACSSLSCLHIGSMVHGRIVRGGFENDVLVRTALMDVYVKCRSIEDAYQVFRENTVKDVVAWTLIISSFSEFGYGNKAIELFNEMMVEGVGLDSISLIGVLSGCGLLGALQHGRRIHGLTVKTGFEDDTFVGTTIVDMYANCGSLDSSRNFFNGMVQKDIICWNAMIAAYGMNGQGFDAINLFLRMKGSSLKPNEATFVSLLYACSHVGLVDQGIQIFDSIAKEWQMIPNVQHYACLIDLLGRAGRLSDAFLLIDNMPLQPDASIYGALLGACRNHGNISLGIEIAEKLFELNPQDAGYYVLLSNIYAVAGDWEGVKMTRVRLRSKGLKKDPGFSSIEVDQAVHEFLAGDRNHPECHKIEEMLKTLIVKIEAAGYVPNTAAVFQDVSDDIKREMLYHHSEKLAIAFGLLRTQAGSAIRITKNLRICNDCHTACKYISKAFERAIIVKDANRFHYFKNGFCSCGDYW